MTPAAPLLVERRGPLALLRLNRPDTRNALSAELVAALQGALDMLADDDSVRALVLTGEGPAFCAGADLRALQEMSGAGSEANRRDGQALADLLHTLYTHPKPVIAAVEGAAVAGGAGLAGACDLTVAGVGARFGYTEVRLGFVAAIVAVFLTRQVGDKHARELLLTGRLVGAAEAHRLGLVNEVVPDGAALERALALAWEVAENSASALASTKRLLAQLPSLGLAQALDYAVTLNAWTRTTDDLKEGVAAFLERREPGWRAALDPQRTE